MVHLGYTTNPLLNSMQKSQYNNLVLLQDPLRWRTLRYDGSALSFLTLGSVSWSGEEARPFPLRWCWPLPLDTITEGSYGRLDVSGNWLPCSFRFDRNCKRSSRQRLIYTFVASKKSLTSYICKNNNARYK